MTEKCTMPNCLKDSVFITIIATKKERKKRKNHMALNGHRAE